MSKKTFQMRFRVLSALVNPSCFLFSAHLGIVLLIIVLQLDSQTERGFWIGEETDLTGRPREHMPVE